MDYFSVRFEERDINAISNLGLAHIGDGVYELLVRTWLCVHGGVRARDMHKKTVAHVSAAAQAQAAER
ncbi:MAG: ribonuclease III, partial [Oscillospiraceae bacterium]|nr:ribonuclease III [Oscillospiraceae bacterium]